MTNFSCLCPTISDLASDMMVTWAAKMESISCQLRLSVAKVPCDGRLVAVGSYKSFSGTPRENFSQQENIFGKLFTP